MYKQNAHIIFVGVKKYQGGVVRKMNKENPNLRNTVISKWFINYSEWDKYKFCDEINDYMFNNVPESSESDRHLIAMLAESVATYIQCVIAIKEEGLVIHDQHGNIIGKSPYVKVMHTQLSLIIKIMRELKLLPKDRLKKY